MKSVHPVIQVFVLKDHVVMQYESMNHDLTTVCSSAKQQICDV